MICNNDSFNNLDIKKDEVIKILKDNKKLVKVKCLKFDLYGRVLVELYNNDEVELVFNKSFNGLLVEKNLAVCYDGVTKKAPWL